MLPLLQILLRFPYPKIPIHHSLLEASGSHLSEVDNVEVAVSEIWITLEKVGHIIGNVLDTNLRTQGIYNNI